MSESPPIDLIDVCQLQSLGVNPASFNFLSTTLQSDHYVCCRETANGKNTVAMVDLKNNNSLTRKNMSADSVIMNPSQFIIALRAKGTALQVFDLSTKKRLKSNIMHEPIVFWQWLNDNEIGLVSAQKIYTWNVMDGTSNGPVELTSRHVSLANCQLTQMVTNFESSWFALCGVAQENNAIVGHIQLFSKARNISQPIQGHVCCFGKVRQQGASVDTQVFACASRTPTGGNLHLLEIEHQPGAPAFQKKTVEVFFPAEIANDFPISIQISDFYGVVYILTKYGFIHVYDLESGKKIFLNRISSDPIFTAAKFDDNKGVITVNRAGAVLAVEIATDRVIPYILNNLADVDLALSLASRSGLPGAEALFSQQFNQSLSSGDYQAAVKIAASSAQMRTPETINRLKALPTAPGQPAPILQYLVYLLDRGSLNQYESLELVRPLVMQNRIETLEKYLKEDKLTCSEEIGDIIKPKNTPIALAVYYKSNTPAKVVDCLAELGQTDKILPFCQKVDYHPNYTTLIQSILRVNPDKAAEIATQLLSAEPDMDIEKTADIFFSQNYIQQGTAFLLDALKDDKPAQGDLQTRLLQVNLLNAPQVADAILGNNIFSHFDRPTIAKLSEQAALYQRALDLYDDTKDIKRVVSQHASEIPPDWVVSYFGKLNVDQSVSCLREMLSADKTKNMQVAIQVATKYSDLIGASKLIKIFEDFNCVDGLYYFLGSIVNTSQDADVVLKYIQCAAKMGQVKEIERVVRGNNVYNGEKVKNFLKEAKLDDQLPLIIVCDRFDFVHDLILYLYKNKFFKFIEVYVQQVNPAKTPQVVAALLDVDCDEQVIKSLLQSVVGKVPIGELCNEVEKRNRLKILLPFLEASLQSGVTDNAIYDTLAKIYIDSNNNPEKFLKENDQYNTLEVGKYCEKRDPYLAYIAYDKGQNDAELVKITNENAMYKYQARYVLKRSDPELWNTVLSDENTNRQQLIDQVIGTAIPEIEDPQPVSIAVKSFMDNGLTGQLVNLLEKIILESSPFNDNPSLQALMILTAIKVDPSKVMGYIERIDAYDPEEVAPVCIENKLYEEAFAIYDKFEKYSDAMKVLTEDVMSLDRAYDYAEKLDQKELWSQLGAAQLNGLRIPEAIDSYMKAEDPSNFEQVIEISEHAGKEEELIPYLLMARKTLQEPVVDGALVNAYATLGKLSEMEKFLQLSNVADLESIGDKLYEAENYDAAKIVYSSISNYSKLASTLVYLKDYQEAVDCARKASNVSVWKQVNQACLENGEFRLAQICGLNLVVHAEELDELVAQYEYNGYFSQLISLFENGLALERAHMGMFTELAILYTKYQPEKTMDHLKLFWSRINMPKVIRACQDAHLWTELVFLYKHYDEWDNASLTMMDHSESAFDHSSFKEVVVKVSNLEIYYKAINFYTNMHPALLNDLLAVLIPRLDLPRVVRIFQKSDNLPLIKPFLISVSEKNNSVVNQAYHDLLIEEHDYKSLRSVIEAHDKFDQLGLAERLEKHDLIFFREIAAVIYRKNKKWNKAISLLKTDKLWADAIETAALSTSSKIATDLFEYFVDTGNREAMVALLYSCYSLIDYDKVLELSWLNNLSDFVKPYEISIARENQLKITELYKDFKARESSKDGEDDSTAPQRLMITNGTGIPTGPNQIGYTPTGAGFGNGGFSNAGF